MFILGELSITFDDDWHVILLNFLSSNSVCLSHSLTLEIAHEHAVESNFIGAASYVDRNLFRRNHFLLKVINSDVAHSWNELFKSQLDLTILIHFVFVYNESLFLGLVHDCVDRVSLSKPLQKNFYWNRLLPELLVSNKFKFVSIENESKVLAVILLNGELCLGSFTVVPSNS